MCWTQVINAAAANYYSSSSSSSTLFAKYKQVHNRYMQN